MADAMTDTMKEAVSYVVGMFNDPSNFAESPLDDVAANLGNENYGEAGFDPYEVIEKAADEYGLDDATKEAVMEAAHDSAGGYDGGEGYSLDQLAGIFAGAVNVTYEGDEIYVDQSLHNTGEVHGNLTNDAYSNVVNADEGAIATGGDVYDSQQQSGDGVQAGDHAGLVNQGDNSGQQAGDDAYADNVTSGDSNTVASKGSVAGNENVQAHDITASEFGDGDQTLTATQDQSYTDNASDSYNTEDSYNQTQKIHEEGYGEAEERDYGHQEEHGHEPVKEAYGEQDDHHDDHHEEEVYDD